MGIQENEQIALLSDYDTDSAYAIAYQTLYNNIRFSWDSKQMQHAIMLAAPVAYPGQATATANVAIAAAQNGVPTILVDADLHTPSLQQRFGIQHASGLLDLLSSETITAESITTHISETFTPGLRLLCAGTASTTLSASKASQLLSTKLTELLACLRDFLAQAEKKPSLIIFNSPPVLASSDASLISALVDQTFLVITAAYTTRTQARQAQDQLQRARGNIAGIIMLDV